MTRLERPDQLRAARKIHSVLLANGLEVQLLDPTLADAARLQACREDISALARVLCPLVVSGEDRRPLFAKPEELAESLPLGDVLTICEFIGSLFDHKAAGKNS